jgi:hypothetical protein
MMEIKIQGRYRIKLARRVRRRLQPEEGFEGAGCSFDRIGAALGTLS